MNFSQVCQCKRGKTPITKSNENDTLLNTNKNKKYERIEHAALQQQK
jgi:hypothetical protein